MTKLSNKQLIEKIRKLALEDPSKIEGGSLETPSIAPVATRDIANMQIQLRDLAEDVIQDIGAQNVGATLEQQVQVARNPNQVPISTPEQIEAWGRINFANFLTEHFIADSDLSAVEFNPNPKVTDMAKEQPTGARRMNVVMDTMRLVGNPKTGEFKVDNIWGPKTNAALRNAYVLAFGLLRMCKEFEIQPRYFDDSDLQQMKDLIPATDTDISLQEKMKRAKELTRKIKLIRGLFSEVKQQMFNKPAYQSYIQGTQPYAIYSKKSQYLMPPDMINRLNQIYAHMNVNDGRRIIPIFVTDLSSVQAFRDWKYRNAVQMSNEDILAQVKKHIFDTGFQNPNKILNHSKSQTAP
jgi:hypothetical protein